MFYSVEIEVTGLFLLGDSKPIIGLVTWRNKSALSEEGAKRRAIKMFLKEQKFINLIKVNEIHRGNQSIKIQAMRCKKITFKSWFLTRRMGFAFYGGDD
jgi:hypothetical protein